MPKLFDSRLNEISGMKSRRNFQSLTYPNQNGSWTFLLNMSLADRETTVNEIDHTQSGQTINLEPGYTPETIKYRVLSKFDGWVYITHEREWNIAAKRLLRAKERFVSQNLDKIPLVLTEPDKVIVDPEYPESTHIYYKTLTIHDGSQAGLAVPISIKEPKYIYTVHSWKGDNVKGETRGLKITWILGG